MAESCAELGLLLLVLAFNRLVQDWRGPLCGAVHEGVILVKRHEAGSEA